MSSYCTVSDVRLYSYLEADDVTNAELETLISDASAEIDEICGNPREVRHQIHDGDLKTTRFRIGGRTNPPKTVTEILRLVKRSKSASEGLETSEFDPTYPRDTDEWTGDYTLWTASNSTLTDDTTYYKNDTSSIKVVIASGTGRATYPTTQDINIDIDDWNYLFFNYRSSVTSAITVKVHEDASNYRTYTFTPAYANSWQWKFIDMDADSTMVETGDPDTINYIVFEYTGALTLYVDGLCLSDGYGVENPASDYGYIIFETAPVGFSISYFFDVFTPVPIGIKMACANITASYAFNRLSGRRLKETSVQLQITTMDAFEDRFRGLAGQAYRHRQTAMDLLKKFGFDFQSYWIDEEL